MKSATEAERLEKLNKAFEKRTTAIQKYQIAMRTLRKEIDRTAGEQLLSCRINWADALAQASRTRDPLEEAELRAHAAAARNEVTAYEAQRAQTLQHQEDAEREMREELQEIDAEILALGGNLNLPKAAGGRHG